MTEDNPLSDLDLKRLCAEMNERANIKTTAELNNLTKEQAFDGRGHVILFHQWSPGEPVGHWVAAVRKKDGSAYFFDSFGKSPAFYGVDKFFKRNFDKVYYNNHSFQDKHSSTCGKYALVVIALNKMLKPTEPYERIEQVFESLRPTDKFVLEVFQE